MTGSARSIEPTLRIRLSVTAGQTLTTLDNYGHGPGPLINGDFGLRKEVFDYLHK